MRFILNRLKERSTWVGIFALLATFGVLHLSPEKTDALLTAIPAIVGVILVFWPDKKTVPGAPYNPDAEVRDTHAIDEKVDAARRAANPKL